MLCHFTWRLSLSWGIVALFIGCNRTITSEPYSRGTQDSPPEGVVYSLPKTILHITLEYTAESQTLKEVKSIKVEPVGVPDSENRYCIRTGTIPSDPLLESNITFTLTSAGIAQSASAEIKDRTVTTLAALAGSAVNFLMAAKLPRALGGEATYVRVIDWDPGTTPHTVDLPPTTAIMKIAVGSQEHPAAVTSRGPNAPVKGILYRIPAVLPTTVTVQSGAVSMQLFSQYISYAQYGDYATARLQAKFLTHRTTTVALDPNTGALTAYGIESGSPAYEVTQALQDASKHVRDATIELQKARLEEAQNRHDTLTKVNNALEQIAALWEEIGKLRGT